MFNKQQLKTDDLQDLIDALMIAFRNTHPEDPQFNKIADQLIKLQDIKHSTKSRKISADMKAGIVANLAGIAMIIGHERANVVTSKALGFVQKLR